MFFKNKKQNLKTYDKAHQIPTLKRNLYTGEKVIGFKEIETGKFKEIQLVQSEEDVKQFLREYQIKAEDLKRE